MQAFGKKAKHPFKACKIQIRPLTHWDKSTRNCLNLSQHIPELPVYNFLNAT